VPRQTSVRGSTARFPRQEVFAPSAPSIRRVWRPPQQVILRFKAQILVRVRTEKLSRVLPCPVSQPGVQETEVTTEPATEATKNSFSTCMVAHTVVQPSSPPDDFSSELL